MKIVLISPFPDVQVFGIRTLSACLKQEGYNVKLMFMPRRFTEEYEKKTLDEVVELSRGARLVGISLMTNFFDNVVQLTERLKRSLSVPVLWGGVHPTIRPEECLNHADMVCIGEGEESLLDLAKRIRDRRYYYDVRGVWFKDEGRIIANNVRPLIQDLDSIPFQDYDYDSHYILHKGCICKMDVRLLERWTGGMYMTMATRGCPFSCAYCCNNKLNKMYPNQKSVRKRSPGNIIKELKEIKGRLPFVNQIKFDDDAFFTNTVGQIEEFSEKYKKNVGLPLYITGATPLTITREKLAPLVDAGLERVRLGIQTASEHTKKIYNRSHSNQQVETAVNIINEFKDRTKPPQYDIILDNPWETDEDLVETLMFLAKLPGPYVLCLYSLTFYPGTELYEEAKRDGLIGNDLEDVYRKYFLSCQKTYLNRLFVLLNDYVKSGSRISPKIMSLLTNRKLRQYKLNWLLYVIIRVVALGSKWLKRFPYLLREGLADIRKGDWSRIITCTQRLLTPPGRK